jgi:hypothetical protein
MASPIRVSFPDLVRRGPSRPRILFRVSSCSVRLTLLQYPEVELSLALRVEKFHVRRGLSKGSSGRNASLTVDTGIVGLDVDGLDLSVLSDERVSL